MKAMKAITLKAAVILKIFEPYTVVFAAIIGILGSKFPSLINYFLNPDYYYSYEITGNPYSSKIKLISKITNDYVQNISASKKEKQEMATLMQKSLWEMVKNDFQESDLNGESLVLKVYNNSSNPLQNISGTIEKTPLFVSSYFYPIPPGAIKQTDLVQHTGNSVSFKYSDLPPEGEAYLKFAFEEIPNPNLKLYIKDHNGKFATGKQLTSEQFKKLNDEILIYKSALFNIFIRYTALMSAIVIAVSGILYKRYVGYANDHKKPLGA